MVGIGIVAVVACSCCSEPPRADKYFHREWDFVETLRQFQYSIETKQYDVAYQCLTPGDQEEFSRSKFELLLWLGTVEALRDVKVRDAVVDAAYNNGWEVTQMVGDHATQGWAQLDYVNQDRGVSAGIQFFFAKIPIEGQDYPDRGEWRLDLLRTAQQFVLSQ